VDDHGVGGLGVVCELAEGVFGGVDYADVGWEVLVHAGGQFEALWWGVFCGVHGEALCAV